MPAKYNTQRRVARKVPLEKTEGIGLTSWVKSHYPDVIWAHVANENQERKIAEGLLKGYPDYVLNEARGGYHGLYIELKRRKGGTVSAEQKKVGKTMTERGYLWLVAKGMPEGKAIVQWYMNQDVTPVTKVEPFPEKVLKDVHK